MKTAGNHISARSTLLANRGGVKRVLIVNTFFDPFRRTKGSPYRVPRAMGPVYLASAFSPARCEVRLYSEQYSGPLEGVDLLGWADMLVLTGLTASFDRMLHLTAYARALKKGVIVVAGGPSVRALPRRAQRFFDYACLGDIEQLQAIIRETLGADYVAEQPFPRFDLIPQGRILAFVESSRYCNFRCSFCSLTAEHRRYQMYDLDYVRRQIAAVGKKHVVFIDNNFYGNDREFFHARLDLLREFHQAGRITGWSAIVTGDLFADPRRSRSGKGRRLLRAFQRRGILRSGDVALLQQASEFGCAAGQDDPHMPRCRHTVSLWHHAGPKHAVSRRHAPRD